MQDPAFSTLLYRYFFFDWLFKDVSSPNVWERAAAVRHNREQARWLPVYMVRWLWCGLVFYGLGEVFDLALQSPGVATLCYAVSALSVPVTVAVIAAWVILRMPVRRRQ